MDFLVILASEIIAGFGVRHLQVTLTMAHGSMFVQGQNKIINRKLYFLCQECIAGTGVRHLKVILTMTYGPRSRVSSSLK